MGKYFPYGIKGPSTIPAVADTILDEFIGIAKELRLPVYLAFGLCLGFVRDKGYIVGDNDLDVAVVTPTGGFTPDMGDMLKKHGFTRKQAYPPPSNNTHFIKNNILLDIYSRNNGGFYIAGSTVEYKKRVYPVPHPVEAYLTNVYDTWKTPDPTRAGNGAL